jgi:Putative beta-barrel porin-2, OmpL-like. bbp2
MKKFTKSVLFILSLTASVSTFAQDATAPAEKKPTFTLSGSVDAYAHSALGNVTKAPSTSFANLNGFALGMANVIASYDGEKAGFKADLVYGPRGVDAVFQNAYSKTNGDTLRFGQRIVNQLYGYVKLGKKTTLNLGQFNTFFGYEVISPTGNFHYSTSYMFTNGPFNHTGLRADFDLGGGLVAKLAVMNPTDIVEFNPVNTYTLGGQIGYANDKGSIYFNVLFGDQDGTLDKNDPPAAGTASFGSTLAVDITAGTSLSDNFYLGFNGTYRTLSLSEGWDGTKVVSITGAASDASGFYGVALYPKYTVSESFALGLRGEYFSVTNKGNYIAPFNFDANGKGSVIALTASANYKVENLTIIPEVRFDSTSENSFLDSDSKASKSLPTFNLAFVYKF